LLTIGLNSQYRYSDISVNKKIDNPIDPDLRPEIANRIKQLRVALGLTQAQFAERCEVKQATVAGWEKDEGNDRPGPVALVRIARLAPESERDWWHERAQLKEFTDAYAPRSASVLRVPLFKDKIAAGAGREIANTESERDLAFPKEWFPSGSKIVALQVEGDSMAPLIMSGYYVLIDVAETDIKRLVGHMVAARAPHGCTVKWLRKWGKFYQLMPQHVSEDYPAPIISEENWDEYGIIGRVVRWIGEPKPPGRVKR
jgi:SOS-response transcriptional repressor LexA